jgi:hypothetical protein
MAARPKPARERRSMGRSGRTRRRSLSLEDLSQIMPEVRRLEVSHRTIARWTLGQICKHLADSINGSIDGFDLSRHRLKRFFFAKRLLRYTFRYGIPRNYLVDPGLTPPDEVDASAAINGLARAIARYQAHRGPLRPHPLFGTMSRDVWDRVHCVHCAHHLSFAIPGHE